MPYLCRHASFFSLEVQKYHLSSLRYLILFWHIVFSAKSIHNNTLLKYRDFTRKRKTWWQTPNNCRNHRNIKFPNPHSKERIVSLLTLRKHYHKLESKARAVKFWSRPSTVTQQTRTYRASTAQTVTHGWIYMPMNNKWILSRQNCSFQLSLIWTIHPRDLDCNSNKVLC